MAIISKVPPLAFGADYDDSSLDLEIKDVKIGSTRKQSTKLNQIIDEALISDRNNQTEEALFGYGNLQTEEALIGDGNLQTLDYNGASNLGQH